MPRIGELVMVHLVTPEWGCGSDGEHLPDRTKESLAIVIDEVDGKAHLFVYDPACDGPYADKPRWHEIVPAQSETGSHWYPLGWTAYEQRD